jgi:S1/P1 nuclease
MLFAFRSLCAFAVLVTWPAIIPTARHGLLTVATAEAEESAQVWVNTKSGVYHCPGSRYYGTTKAGDHAPRLCALTMMILMPVQRVGSWYDLGHRMVARIAEQRLTPNTAEAVRDILGGQTLADASVWADNIRQYRHDADALHYVNIPLHATAYDPARDCLRGRCLIAAIVSDTQVLANPAASPLDRAEALRFLVHFMGDLHQPLHVADNHDRGGNQRMVQLSPHT